MASLHVGPVTLRLDSRALVTLHRVVGLALAVRPPRHECIDESSVEVLGQTEADLLN